MNSELKGYTPDDMPRIKPRKVGEYNITIVTRNASPGQFGYDLTFIPPEEGLLVPDPDWSSYKDDREKPRFIAYDTLMDIRAWRFRDSVRPVIRVSDEGRQLLDNIGLEQMWENMYNPDAWGGEEFARHSESVVKKVEIGGRMCVLKQPNTEAVRRLNDQTAFRITYSGPHYEYYFGVTTQIATILSNAQDHFSSFKLGKSPTEYAAGKLFHIEEYLEGQGTVDDIYKLVQPTDERGEDELYLGHTKKHWRLWYDRFSKEVERVEDVFFMRREEQETGTQGKRISLFGNMDLHPSNWIIRHIDSETGMPTLSLIDQTNPEPTPQGGMWDVAMMENAARYERLSLQYRDDPLLRELRDIDV